MCEQTGSHAPGSACLRVRGMHGRPAVACCHPPLPTSHPPGPTCSVRGSPRAPSCPLCSAACATGTWRAGCFPGSSRTGTGPLCVCVCVWSCLQPPRVSGPLDADGPPSRLCVGSRGGQQAGREHRLVSGCECGQGSGSHRSRTLAPEPGRRPACPPSPRPARGASLGSGSLERVTSFPSW